MAGKFCTGVTNNNNGPSRIRDMKAFTEGLEYRAGGTTVSRPASDNPHDGLGNNAETSWDEGWAVAEAAKGGTITPSDAPCVAVTSETIAA